MSNYRFKRSYLTARKDVSGLIRMALNDLEAVEKDSAYFIAIESMYHQPIVYECVPTVSTVYQGSLPTYQETRCGVCLAGAVMVRRFDSKPTDDLAPDEESFAPLVNRQLLALNTFRCGEARQGWQYLFHTDPNPWEYEEYDDDNYEWVSRPVSEPYPLSQSEYVVPRYANAPAGFKRALRAMADRFEKAGY